MTRHDREVSTVLIVDDDKAIREVLNHTLALKGYVPLEAADGQEAIDKADCCDLILLDLILPKKTGIEVIMEMRSKGNYTPVIVMSASHDRLREVEDQKFDVVELISKPFNMSRLMTTVDKCLRLNHSLKHLQTTAQEMTTTLDSVINTLNSLGMTALK